ncbi:unnamed protein product [Clonostachys chloroleuca]|uniref:Inositol polyphosphate-related phosphatase domain-containing protein n=1 Tax=Clonostachys chloroleuca TaxID=1926264 RepID=A0AA35MGZ5_9HYPO|nr:unnamed protein product [Clonostachys chloroleuca]
MASADGDGPDGSSLRPVSSIRARFENMGKGTDGPASTQVAAPAPAPAPTPTLAPQKPPSRPISPAPKPNKLKDFKPSQETATSVPSTPTIIPPTPTTPAAPPRPKEKPKIPPSPFIRQDALPSAAGANHINTPPRPNSTKPIVNAKAEPLQPQAPAVTVQPPLSPPKVRPSTVPVGEHPSLLNPETAVSIASGPGSPSRPLTPSPASPSRSPRSKAPSPPPPRRSAELRRDKETKVPPPPPNPRREKAVLDQAGNIRSSSRDSSRAKTPDVAQETSPFSSPPISPRIGNDDDEVPPELPVRPRPRSTIMQAARPKSTATNFEPPPVHHSISVRRGQRTEERNGSVSHGRSLDDARPKPASKITSMEPPPRPVSMIAPPRPPRPGVQAPAQISAQIPERRQSTVARRASSNPTTQQSPIPATRTHGRSGTVDSKIERPPIDMRSLAPAIAPVKPAPSATSNQIPVPKVEAVAPVVTYPDCSSTNRRAPFVKRGIEEIATKYDPRIFDVCGENVCTSGQLTRVWNVLDGELIMSLAHTEGIKATSVAFKPAADPQNEGWKIWIGTTSGEIMEVDVETHEITNSKGGIHGRREVIRMYRHFNEMWTLDELGTLLVWGPHETGVPNVAGNPHQSFKVPRDHTFSMVVGSELWHATGKEVRIFAPTLHGRDQFQVLIRPLVAEGAGEVTAGSQVKTQPGKVYLGHSDGKVSIWSTIDYSCLAVLSISTWKINALVGVGQRIWVGYNNGRTCVYEISETPWTILKEWQAHSPANPVLGIKADPASCYRLDRLQVVSLGADNKLKIWDGLLEDDWVEDEMKSKDTEYCEFDEIRAMVFTWNAGASTPSSLRYSHNDGEFFPDLIKSSGAPDILIFGFQELVDLEDKAATAKRFLKVKKKKEEGTDQERMSHQYRDWRDFLKKTLDDYTPTDDLYHLLHTAPLVGLFQCVFVKSSLRDRIRNLNAAEVKRGMGGYHGNKGAVAVRFQIDDSSVCFVNCHLAAGQSQASARHNDIAEILDSSLFPAERDPSVRIDSFAGGGDGTLVVDHELCILNGDLNYRIDTMSRDTVVGAVKQNNLGKLLERDQLLVARRRNPTFKLRAFEELPITFAPTYKYDVGTDNYDSSEKKRSPAWCDRLLFRGRGRVQQLDYRRHEVYVSDHRPVTGNFRLWVKRVNHSARAKAWMESQQSFEVVRERETADEKLHYLMTTCGYDEATSKQLIRERAKPHRGH